MKNLARLMAVTMALLTSACTQFNFAVVNAPNRFDSVRITRNVAFGPEAWQKLDIYAPDHVDGTARLPVIVFYYGGRWETGRKEDYAFVGSVLAQRNYIVVIPDYRKYPDVKFPTFVEDAAMSLAWTSDHIAAYGGQEGALHLAGHSAGAHIASLLATDPRYLGAYGKTRAGTIADFVGLAGPYDFVPDDPDLRDMFGPPDRYPLIKATHFVDGRQPPMLLLWGAQDQYVGRQNIDRLAAAVRAKGGCVETRIYPKLDHVWLIATLSWLGSSRDQVLADWLGFISHPHDAATCRDQH